MNKKRKKEKQEKKDKWVLASLFSPKILSVYIIALAWVLRKVTVTGNDCMGHDLNVLAPWPHQNLANS